MRRILVIILLITIAVTVALSFHQPPMRLMPTPQAFRDGLPPGFRVNAAAGSSIEIFYATNRLPLGLRTNRVYAVVPSRDLHLGVATVRIGGPEDTIEWLTHLSTSAAPDRRPRLPLQSLAEMATIEDDATRLSPGTRAWLALVNAAIARSPDKDVIIYVHGANSTVERAAGQAAQLRHFTGHNATVVLFAWPTAENFLVYPRDIVTAYGAAPQLARLIALLSQHSRARRVDVLTYSAGGTVGSDGLALAGRMVAGGTPIRLGEVIHAAPDADTRGFVDDLRDYVDAAQRVTVMANMGDSALRLSSAINRGSRAGRPDFAELSPNATRFLLAATRPQGPHRGLELVRVRPDYFPALANGSHSFWYDDPWVSTDVLLQLLFAMPPDARGLDPATAMVGPDMPARYWGFPRDYAARLPGVLATLRPAERAED